MIGVIAPPSEQAVIREFFELFKTAWEFRRDDARYEVILCSGDCGTNQIGSGLILTYAAAELEGDSEARLKVTSRGPGGVLLYKDLRIPVYGGRATFGQNASEILTDEECHEAVVHRRQEANSTVLRIGYDLFAEVSRVLTLGQPAEYAGIPTLDLHIELMRDLIVSNGIPLIEIPPVPDRYRFIACLTHDVDHPLIRNHHIDHTVLGFLYRAVFGSVVDFCRGRLGARGVAENWKAVLKLPLVHLGLVRDFWSEFPERYLEVEKDIRSTYFVLPFKDRAGHIDGGAAPGFRAARYGARDICDAIAKITRKGCEVGLHGIDAWRDSSRGQAELEEIRGLTAKKEVGVRMHWLYFDHRSPKLLEEAGATYDSTVGYRETVGYRAGTMQAFKPFQTDNLLELPMHVMDTALFYPAYMGLSQRQASALLRRMVDNASRFGGCLTVNWHDRSLLPERLWSESYVELIHELRARGAWVATAGEVISWFRKRRSAVFNFDSDGSGASGAELSECGHESLPGLRLRFHGAMKTANSSVQVKEEQFVDVAFQSN